MYKYAIFFILFFWKFSIYKCEDEDEYLSHYYCSNRIFEEDSKLKASELNELCSIISQNDRFIIRFPKIVFLDIKLYKRELNTLSIYSKKYEEEDFSEIIKYAININKPYESMKYLLENIIVFLDNNDDEKNPIVPKNITVIIDDGASKISILVIFLIIAIPICFICFVVNSAFTLNNYEILNNQPYIIHEYFKKIKSVIKEIEKNKTYSVKTDKCILCFRKIIPHVQRMSFEMKDLSNFSNENSRKTTLLSPEDRFEIPIDDMNIRFNCGHVFHNQCLRKIRLDWCILCNDQNKNLISICNKNPFQIINLNHLYRLLVNFKRIYTEEELKKYVIVYGNEIEEYKDKILRKNLNENKNK